MGAAHLADITAPPDHAGLALGTESIAGGILRDLFPGSRPVPSSIGVIGCFGRWHIRTLRPGWAPRGRVRKSGRTIFRAGGGLFYDSSLSIATDLINSGPFSITEFTNGIFGFVPSLLSYAFSPTLRLPRLTEWNITLDQPLGAHDVLSVGYVGSKGRRLIRREVGGPETPRRPCSP
jgi:hypothetical protein